MSYSMGSRIWHWPLHACQFFTSNETCSYIHHGHLCFLLTSCVCLCLSMKPSLGSYSHIGQLVSLLKQAGKNTFQFISTFVVISFSFLFMHLLLQPPSPCAYNVIFPLFCFVFVASFGNGLCFLQCIKYHWDCSALFLPWVVSWCWLKALELVQY